MAFQCSTAVRNAILNAIETAIGPNAVMKIRTGAPPADLASADTGTVLATLDLPADWLADANAGQKAKAGVWQDATPDNAADAGHFRIYAADGTTPHLQGTVTVNGGGGDLQGASIAIVLGTPVTITNFTLIAPNA